MQNHVISERKESRSKVHAFVPREHSFRVSVFNEALSVKNFRKWPDLFLGSSTRNYHFVTFPRIAALITLALRRYVHNFDSLSH